MHFKLVQQLMFFFYTGLNELNVEAVGSSAHFAFIFCRNHRFDCGIAQGEWVSHRGFSLLTRQLHGPDLFSVSKHITQTPACGRRPLNHHACPPVPWLPHSQESPHPCLTTGLRGHKQDLLRTVTSLTRMARSQRSEERVNPKFSSCIFVSAAKDSVAVETKSSDRWTKSGLQNKIVSPFCLFAELQISVSSV